MTWEQTIQFIRGQPAFAPLVEKAYLEPDLVLNIERFRASVEWVETIAILKNFQPNAKQFLDIGSGNGVSAISFALEGFNVYAVEPDPSNSIGAGAIRILKDHYHLSQLSVHETFAEDLDFPNGYFDVVYARQSMHHAYDLQRFVGTMGRLLRPGGLFLTIRDHVVTDALDKETFLEKHPLQKYYGGENAFTDEEYQMAIRNAGLVLQKVLHFFDSPINYFPLTHKDLFGMRVKKQTKIDKLLHFLLVRVGRIPLFSNLLLKYIVPRLNEDEIPGRMYSYIALKS